MTSKRPDRCSSVLIWSAATWASWLLLPENEPGETVTLNGGTPTRGLFSPRSRGGGAKRPTSAVSLSLDADSLLLAQPQARTRPARTSPPVRKQRLFTWTSVCVRGGSIFVPGRRPRRPVVGKPLYRTASGLRFNGPPRTPENGR